MVNFKSITDKAKELVEKRGGTDSLKEDAGELKDIAKGPGTLSDKAKAAVEELSQQLLLRGHPGVLAVRVGVHRAAEGHDGVVAEGVRGRIGGLGDVPLVEPNAAGGNRLGEDARAGITLMDDRQRAHPRSLSPRRTYVSPHQRWSVYTFGDGVGGVGSGRGG